MRSQNQDSHSLTRSKKEKEKELRCKHMPINIPSESELRKSETEFSYKFLRPLLAFTLRTVARTKLKSKPGPQRDSCFSRAHRKPPPTRFYKYLNKTVVF